MSKIVCAFLLFLFNSRVLSQNDSLPYIIVLGIAQDGGYPHIGCVRNCCATAWQNDSLKKNVVSLALVSPAEKKWWLLEATPDISKQLNLFSGITNNAYNFLPDGIFITHAHMGHYTGLMQLGREALNSAGVQVHVLPAMKTFLEKNGPWSQLVELKNIQLNELKPNVSFKVSPYVSILPFTVQHRDEFSETAGFKIETKNRKYLFIPDVDKWQKFKKDIVTEVKLCDLAFLDATFFSEEELAHRNVKEVPHPSVIETMALFEREDMKVRNKIYFIHFNHTNPLLIDKNRRDEVLKKGFMLAEEGQTLR